MGHRFSTLWPPTVMMAELLLVLAVGCAIVAVTVMVQIDGTLSGDGRGVVSAASVWARPGSRAQRRYELKASPVLYLLSSVFALLVMAALV
jgi:hypothetical protein